MEHNGIEVYMLGRNGRYKAQGIYKNGKITVCKGSKISREVSITNMANIVASAWNNKTVIDDSNIVLQDIEMGSPSTAAQFVTGYSVNGMLRWKVSENETLKDILGRKNEEA